MKINKTFLHKAKGDNIYAPLVITGDKDELILRKSDGFDEWLADTSKVALRDLGKTTYTAQNQEVLRRIILAWLHGEEYTGD